MHVQITCPVAATRLGLSVMVTAVPTEVELPAMVTTPAEVTEPEVTLPPGTTVKPAPALVRAISDCAFSAMLVLNALAAKTSSDTLARMV